MPSNRITPSRALGALALTALVAVCAVPASAQQAKPEPCDGKLLKTDPAGDQTTNVQGQPLFATPDNTDVLGYFFRVDGDKVTANIVISDLNTTPMSGFSAIRYRAYATVDGEVHYFQALVTSGGTTYSYGGELPAVAYTEQGSTTGALFEGKNGIVQIVLPPDVGGKVGTALGATSATIGLLTAPVPAELMTPPFYFQADTAPDASADGPSTTAVPCASTTTPAPGGGLPAAPPTISVKASPTSAKKASKSKSVSVAVSTSEPLSAVVLKLKKGSTIVASGKAASLSGTSKVKLKLKQKKLKKGTYTLSLSAKRASGAAVSATFKIKLKS